MRSTLLIAALVFASGYFFGKVSVQRTAPQIEAPRSNSPPTREPTSDTIVSPRSRPKNSAVRASQTRAGHSIPLADLSTEDFVEDSNDIYGSAEEIPSLSMADSYQVHQERELNFYRNLSDRAPFAQSLTDASDLLYQLNSQYSALKQEGARWYGAGGFMLEGKNIKIEMIFQPRVADPLVLVTVEKILAPIYEILARGDQLRKVDDKLYMTALTYQSIDVGPLFSAVLIPLPHSALPPLHVALLNDGEWLQADTFRWQQIDERAYEEWHESYIARLRQQNRND